MSNLFFIIAECFVMELLRLLCGLDRLPSELPGLLAHLRSALKKCVRGFRLPRTEH